MRYFFCFVFTVIISFTFAFGQERWTLYDEIDGIQIFYRYAECPDNHPPMEYLLLQFINTTTDTLICQYKRELWYDNKCVSCDDPYNEFRHQIILSPEEEFTGSCDSKFRGTKIFSKFLNFKSKQLTKFEITDFNVIIKQ
ncbi:MAG: hypothetical protein Kow0068_03430 [Marinilabiliales bacterium]